jgi:hypothetical protein
VARVRPAAAPQRCRAAEEAGGSAGAQSFESLRAGAEAAGAVAVIVRLCVPFRPEGELSDQAARRQRAQIARAQATLMKKLDGFRVSSVRRYVFTPFVSMSVDAAALLRLRGLSVVASVAEDVTLAPAQE